MAGAVLNPWRLFNRIGASGSGEAEVEFASGGALLRAVIPSNQLWVAIKDVLVYEDYEYLEGFRLSRLPARATVVDAGAFVGLYSLKASRYAQKVVAVEPNPKSFSYLESNIRLNGVHNVEPRRFALSTRSGYSRFSQAGTISALDEQGESEVQTTTLDAVVGEVGHVDLLKMDIEGAEYDVFAASASSLARIAKIVAEVHVYNDAHRHGLGELAVSLRQAGFQIRFLEAPFQSAWYGMTKPWNCPLKRYNGGRANLYRLMLSAIYGTGPVASVLKRGKEIGWEALLYAYREE